jgi:cell division septation protein DedD
MLAKTVTENKLDPYFGEERSDAPPVLRDTVAPEAPSTSARGFHPGYRVIGAAVLVLLAIVLLPFVFSKRELRDTTRVAPDGESDTQLVVTDVGRGSASGKANEGIPPPISPVAFPPDIVTSPEVVSESASPERPEKGSPNEKATAERSAVVASSPMPAPPAGKSWYVQMGVFAQTSNAERLRDQLNRAGFDAVSIESADGGRKRVRVGPYDDAGRARTALATIERKTGLRGVVRELR